MYVGDHCCRVVEECRWTGEAEDPPHFRHQRIQTRLQVRTHTLIFSTRFYIHLLVFFPFRVCFPRSLFSFWFKKKILLFASFLCFSFFILVYFFAFNLIFCFLFFYFSTLIFHCLFFNVYLQVFLFVFFFCINLNFIASVFLCVFTLGFAFVCYCFFFFFVLVLDFPFNHVSILFWSFFSLLIPVHYFLFFCFSFFNFLVCFISPLLLHLFYWVSFHLVFYYLKKMYLVFLRSYFRLVLMHCTFYTD